MNRSVIFGSTQINFDLTYTKRKSLGIKVHPTTLVEVLAPYDAAEEIIFQKVRTRASWILKQIEYFNSYKPVTPHRRFVNGETHLYLGRQYRLKIILDTNEAIKAYRGQLSMQAANLSTEALKKQLSKWYRQRAVVIFEELLEEVFPKFRHCRILKPLILIRNMSKRWGSCTRNGKIILNPELIKAPKGCIEYVIIHELCHLVYHNHTRAFFDLLSSLMPDWRKRKYRLEYGSN